MRAAGSFLLTFLSAMALALALAYNSTLDYSAGFDGTMPPAPCKSARECGYEALNDPLEGAAMLAEGSSVPCTVSEHLKISSNWYGYIANMSLSTAGGRFYYRVVYPEINCCVKLLIYMDEQRARMRSPMDCFQKTTILDPLSPQIITLSPNVPNSGCKSVHDESVGRIDCNGGRIIRSTTQRTWYLAVSSCGSPTGLELSYKIKYLGHTNPCSKFGNNRAVSLFTPTITALAAMAAVATVAARNG